ncbi:MAG TPA: hypothetical protein VM802_23920 [Chitinophaga sp.]|uniref:hypothetical protein n=1 Tax=Chitinophaga sp. TaxID=1869181 RepID=UPI002D17A3A1|nr:hypothetical protein [Chitinophaga sp.]HVI47936.1 hypothetical protein [Chitinophaga sp.]
MKPFLYKILMSVCLAGMLSVFLFACNSSKEATDADSAAIAMPKVDTVSAMPVDTTITRPDTSRH